MDFKRHIETAWNLTLGNVVSLILITLVMVAVSSLTLGILAPVTMAVMPWRFMSGLLEAEREFPVFPKGSVKRPVRWQRPYSSISITTAFL